MQNRSILCKCFPPATCTNGSECSSTIGCFYSVQTDITGSTIDEHYGCLPNNAFVILTCFNSLGAHISCCFSSNSSDFCNAGLARIENQNTSAFLFSFVVFAVVCVLIVLLPLVYFKLKYKARRKITNHCSPECYPELTDSGSGAGKPFLVNRTIARQTTILECVGKGRFGEVWRASYNEEAVAVKIFSSRDGASWARETQIYTTALLCHPNILAFYASDMISRGGCTQLWLVTAYHSAGSLLDFLRTSAVVTLQCGLKLARSIAAGLAFLHGEVAGFHGKPSIAHRDIKSRNILVMSNNEACIADFGLALVNNNKEINEIEDDGEMKGIPPPASPFAGTKRYMSPELLSLYIVTRSGCKCVELLDCQTGNELSLDYREEKLTIPEALAGCRHPMLAFEVYQSADIYALGLVFWEIWRRCIGEQYELPYHDAVPADPTFLQMYRVVVIGETFDSPDDSLVLDLPLPIKTCHLCSHLLFRTQSNLPGEQHYQLGFHGKRPSLAIGGHSDAEESWLSRWADVIAECWHPCYTHRLSALRVRKTLAAIEAMLEQANDH